MTLAQPKVGSPLDPNRDDPDSHAEATRHFKTLLQSRARKSRGHCFARNFPKMTSYRRFGGQAGMREVSHRYVDETRQ